MRTVYWGLGLLVLIFVVAGTASATHYRYGTLSWEPTENANEVRFSGGQAWRSSAFFSGTPTSGQLANVGSLAFTDGTSAGLYVKVTSASAINDYFTGTFTDAGGQPIVHTFPSANNAGAPWVASFSSCCRISAHSSGNFHANNPDGSERLETIIDLTAPANSAPKSNLPPINPCPRESFCSIPIPFADSEFDTVTFRLATTTEAGDTNFVHPGLPQAPNAATVSSAGVLSWDTHGATVSADPNEHTLYSMQIMLEDGRTKTPLDFFIEILPFNVNPPVWVTPPTPCGSSILTDASLPVGFDIEAMSPDGRNVLVQHLGIPAGALLPIPPAANPATTSFSWTPGPGDAGTHLIVLTAEDDRGYAAQPCAITISVVLGPLAVAGPDICVPFGSTVTLDGSGSLYPLGTILDHRWDFPHGASPVHGAIIARTFNDPLDLLAPYDVTLTITTNDSRTATDTLRVHVYDSLSVTATSDKPRYTPFQRPSGTASAAVPCAGSVGGAPIDLTVTYTTNDPALDAQLLLLLGPDALVYHVVGTLDASGNMRWSLPFTVAERFALPLGLLNPTSQLLALQGDYVVRAEVASGGVDGVGESRFDVVLDPQFPLDEPPAAAEGARDEEES